MKIHSAEFMIGAASTRQFPHHFLPEVAFAGKSNVGKSSLINSLLNRKHLVKTSSTPGKTQQINFFNINQKFCLVDLPGYGFAQAPKSVRASWEELISGYLSGRAPLRGVVLIVDIRHAPGELDRWMRAWLNDAGIPTLVVANKADKIKRAQQPKHLKVLADQLELPAHPLTYSAKDNTGRIELWGRIGQWLEGGSGTAPTKP